MNGILINNLKSVPFSLLTVEKYNTFYSNTGSADNLFCHTLCLKIVRASKPMCCCFSISLQSLNTRP